MRRFGNWTAFALALAAAATGAPARADMPPLGPLPPRPVSKSVPVTVEVDWGVFADRVSRRHVVVAGETLRAIAAKELGNAARSKAIVEANPDVIKDPNLIRANDVIWLPPLTSFEPLKSLEKEAKPADPVPPAPAPTPVPSPGPAPVPVPVPVPPGTPMVDRKAPPAEPSAGALEPWYDAFWFAPKADSSAGPGTITARIPAGTGPYTAAQSGSVVLFPHPQAIAVIAALAKGPVPMAPDLARVPQIVLGTNPVVAIDDPTVRIVAKYKLTGVVGSTISADFERSRRDATGATVTKEWPLSPPAPAAPPVPTPPGSPPTPPVIGMAGASASSTIVVAPIPKAAETPAAPPADDSRWPDSTGLIVAGMGAALVAALVLIRRQKAAAAKASTDGPPDPPSDPPAA